MRTHGFLPEPQPQLFFVLRATVLAGKFEWLCSGCAHISKQQGAAGADLGNATFGADLLCAFWGNQLAMIWPRGLEHSVATGTAR